MSYILLSLLLPATLWDILGGIFLCHPVAKLFNPTMAGHCMSQGSYWLSAAGVNTALDFITLLLPMPAVAGLHLPRRQKVALMLVFLLGFFVCVVGVVRFALVKVTSDENRQMSRPSPLSGSLSDITDTKAGSGLDAITWSAVEANVGIVCASLMALKPLVIKLCPKLLEEKTIPRHSLRLQLVKEQSWSPTMSDQTTLASPYPGSESSPTIKSARMRDSVMLPSLGKARKEKSYEMPDMR